MQYRKQMGSIFVPKMDLQVGAILETKSAKLELAKGILIFISQSDSENTGAPVQYKLPTWIAAWISAENSNGVMYFPDWALRVGQIEFDKVQNCHGIV